MKNFGALVFLIISTKVLATDPYPRNDAIDVKHYQFGIEVNDSTDRIAGEAMIEIAFNKVVSDFELDLITRKGETGMQVTGVLDTDRQAKFTHQNDRLRIFLNTPVKKGELRVFLVSYNGVPRDGLTIGKNKFGDRGFFGDNWPDRGRHWLPVVDHPSDKAKVDFIIKAPLHYSVVANGVKTEESFWMNGQKLTHWREEQDIPVKVMVVGIARFAVQYVGKVDDIPVETWVYPQDRLKGFDDFAVAPKILDYFHRHIGTYNYKKLANVQSKTRWGGLENANTIFYSENTVDGKGGHESLISHEIAHQWFGNSATERDWYHVWLSEGFATYFSHLYLEDAFGHDRLTQEESNDRMEVIQYFKKNPAPVVDSTHRDLDQILNINTYQKGGWVLHMLRHRMGDQAFWEGIRNYYDQYRNGNALTSDFQNVMSAACKTDLSYFFNQWIYRGGHPRIEAKWSFNASARILTITVNQTQPGPAFDIPLSIGIRGENGPLEIKTFSLDAKTHQFTVPIDSRPQELSLDPEVWLLFEGKITAQ